jgi:hypothetical protein
VQLRLNLQLHRSDKGEQASDRNSGGCQEVPLAHRCKWSQNIS